MRLCSTSSPCLSRQRLDAHNFAQTPSVWLPIRSNRSRTYERATASHGTITFSRRSGFNTSLLTHRWYSVLFRLLRCR